jgi:alpha-L-rhamnosidase
VFFDKYLQDVRDEQLGNGVIPVVAPVPPVGSYSYTGYDASAGWSEAIGEIPYIHYKMYGDKKIVRDNLPELKKLLDYYQTESPDYIRGYVGRYGDWLSLGKTSDLSVISTLYYARAAQLAEELCTVVNDYEKDYYADLYKSIKSAFLKKFTDEDGKIFSDTQSVYVIAYSFGLTNKESTKKHLERKFREDDGKLTTGFLGIRFLLPVLCEVGLRDIAYRLITNTEFPGWGYSIVNGATTIWERWDSYTEKDGIKKGMNSFNHYSLGSCTEWMYSYCLGIRPLFENPGCKKVRFAPYFDTSGKINSACGYYKTDYGKINISWEKKNGYYTYSVSAPLEIECEFSFDEMNIVNENCKDGNYYFELIESV